MTETFLAGRCGIEAVNERYGGSEARQRHLDGLRRSGEEAYAAALDEERKEIERLGSDPVRQAISYEIKTVKGLVSVAVTEEEYEKVPSDFKGPYAGTEE